MNLSATDIDELIKQYLILQYQYSRLEDEKDKLNLIIDCKDEEIKTLKEILGINKEESK